MTTPCIITVAITGSLPRKKDNPAVPITAAEQIESTHEALEAGATLVHVRLDKETLAPSNASLVQQVVDLCDEYERRPATVAEARALLSLPQATPPGH